LDSIGDPLRCSLRLFVLPNPDHDPTRVLKSLIRVCVSALVSRDLLGPVPPVHRMATTAVLGAAVPKAPVIRGCFGSF